VKTDSEVLCIPESYYQECLASWLPNSSEIGHWTRLLWPAPRDDDDSGLMFEGLIRPRATFLPWVKCCVDPAWRQVVPYVMILVDGEQLFHFRPGPSAGKLAGRLSVGLAGHARIQDFDAGRLGTVVDRRGFERAVWRGFAEEIRLGVPPSSFDCLGIVARDDEGGQARLGVVYCCELKYPDFTVREKGDVAAGGVAPIATLKGVGDLEGWSRILLTEVF
jgi:predicted NUDIX family phosphoesterase